MAEIQWEKDVDAKYKASGQPGALKEAAALLKQRYPDSTWATKASVWAT